MFREIADEKSSLRLLSKTDARVHPSSTNEFSVSMACASGNARLASIARRTTSSSLGFADGQNHDDSTAFSTDIHRPVEWLVARWEMTRNVSNSDCARRSNRK